MAFQKGNAVEVSSKEDGLVGSYYEAKVIKKLANKKYIVQYSNLVEEKDSKLLLREIVEEEELRPVPPKVPVTGFTSGEMVDAFDNDGWWVGVVSHEECPDIYEVWFESYKKAKFAASELRVHQDWVNSKYWLTSEYN
ncbi:DUF724 domain-containing protein 3 [Heracleum sosnowskyi]|uniref:DUF724 domain-containing protein 3 n=1 Tax=Heracleum sosnowskyi TaxID=360622 RepID=A0AAD8LY71_9APIA|nr:DUF724 domain-containing protein 3 [Heracleum sosnowskyi]